MAVKFLKLRFTEEQYEWLREKAFRERTTMTAIIHGLIDEAMRQEGGSKDEALQAARTESAEESEEDAYVSSLQELTGQESGIVVYGREGILCNWSSIPGLPRIFATGLIGLGEKIPKVKGERRDDIRDLLEGVDITICAHYDDEDLPATGTVYRISDDVVVIAPDDWC